MTDGFKIRLENIRYLTQDEKAMYIERASRGDSLARDMLIESYVRLAFKLAKRYSSACYMYGIDPEDIEACAYEGLVKAVNRLNFEKTAAFVTYVTITIMGEMQHYLRNQFLSFSYPRDIRELILYKIPNARETLIKTYGREPSNKELARYICVDEKSIAEALNVSQSAISLQQIILNGDDEEYCFADTVADLSAQNEDEIIEQMDLKMAINTIDDPEVRAPFMDYYFYEQGINHIKLGKKYGYSGTEAGRRINRGVNKSKNYFKAG